MAVNPGKLLFVAVVLATVASLGIAGTRIANAPERPQDVAVPAPLAAPSPPPEPKGPPCIHQVCGERPKYLHCIGGWAGGSCGAWEINYEHHCDCDTWGPVPP